MLETYPDVLTSREVMNILDIKHELLYKLIKRKELPAYRIGRKSWRFNKQDLINSITRN